MDSGWIVQFVRIASNWVALPLRCLPNLPFKCNRIKSTTKIIIKIITDTYNRASTTSHLNATHYHHHWKLNAYQRIEVCLNSPWWKVKILLNGLWDIMLKNIFLLNTWCVKIPHNFYWTCWNIIWQLLISLNFVRLPLRFIKHSCLQNFCQYVSQFQHKTSFDMNILKIHCKSIGFDCWRPILQGLIYFNENRAF